MNGGQAVAHRREAHGLGPRFLSPRRGLTLIEVTISTLLVGLVLAGAMRLLGAAVRADADAVRGLRAQMLAEDLLGEAMQQSYAEPDAAAAFGVESPEPAAGPRSLWDDVDDYHGLDESLPQDQAGTALSEAAGYRRQVAVVMVDPGDLATALAATDDRGVKRVTVTVSAGGTTLATLVGVQTRAWIDMIPRADNETTTGSLPPGNGPPTARATATPPSGRKPLAVAFDATASTDPDGDPLGYLWDFGDGTTGAGAKPSHTFAGGSAAVTRTVTLTVTDLAGASATTSLAVTITP